MFNIKSKRVYFCSEEPIKEFDDYTLNLMTKYYSASITMNLIDLADTEESILDNAEGFILVPSEVPAALSIHK